MATLFAGIEELGGGRIIRVITKEAERAEGRSSSSARWLTRRDRDAVFAALPHVVDHTMVARVGRRDAIADNGQMVRTDVMAGDGAFFNAMRLELAKGHLFTEEDNLRHGRVCVVGHK